MCTEAVGKVEVALPEPADGVLDLDPQTMSQRGIGELSERSPRGGTARDSADGER